MSPSVLSGKTGVPELPVPGRRSDHIPSDVHLQPGQDGIPAEDVDSGEPPPGGDEVSHERQPVDLQDTEPRAEQDMRGMYVTKKMI